VKVTLCQRAPHLLTFSILLTCGFVFGQWRLLQNEK